MRKYIAAAAIAIGLVVATPAEAHCPNACSTGWFYKAKATGANGYSTVFGYPVKPDGALSAAEVNRILAVHFDYDHSVEGLITSGTMTSAYWTKGHQRKSGSAIYALNWAKYGWRYTPRRITEVNRLHGCTVDENPAGGYYHYWRVACVHY